jgi:hypothetical protein
MITIRRVLFSLAMVSLPLLAGCNSSGNSSGNFPTPPPAGSGFVYYTANPSLGVVAYPITATSTLAAELTPSVANGLGTTVDIAFDANGRLFVVNQALLPNTSTISVFTPPLTAASPATFILTMPVAGCTYGIAFDSSNHMWISDCNTKIYEFDGPFTATGTLPAANITLTSNTFAFGLAFDPSGNLWVTLDVPNNGIEEYVKGAGFTNATPVNHTITGLDHPLAIAFDKAGDLFSSGRLAAQGTSEYLSTNLAAGAAPNILDPTGLAVNFFARQFAFDALGNLYTTDCSGGGHIYVYPTATMAFSATLPPLVYTDANITSHFCALGIAIH